MTEDEIDDLIDDWHDGDSKLELHEFLGVSRELYGKFIEQGYEVLKDVPTPGTAEWAESLADSGMTQREQDFWKEQQQAEIDTLSQIENLLSGGLPAEMMGQVFGPNQAAPTNLDVAALVAAAKSMRLNQIKKKS